MSGRIVKTTFPGKVATTGRMTYIRIPKEVVDRMSLESGQDLDVTISLPEYEENLEDEAK